MSRQPAGPRPGRPDPAVLHRAVRVTAAACTGFYTFRYGLGQPVTATYALFGAIAIGALARIGGSARARVRTLGLTLPAAWALVGLGTVLAVHAWTAALGMVGVGFAVAYGSVGGPRMVGLANGLQLFYILPCFPPYAPDALPQRLAGVSVGILLLAAAELLLWPERPPPAYRDRLAAAVAAVADLADRAAAHAGAVVAVDGSPGAPGPRAAEEEDAARAQALALLDELRFSRCPLMERPASAGAVDRALSHCAATVRYTCAQLLRVRRLGAEGGPYPGAAALLAATARTLREAGAGLRAAGPVPVAGPIEAEIAAFEATRVAGPDGRAEPVGTAAARLGLGAVSLDAAEGSRFLVLAVRISRRAPLPPDDTPADQRPGPFWYAHASAAALWWRRFRANLTPRSVYFQNALRIAAALGAARLVAGALDLAHGFWVLLATLTLMRTSAVDTRMTLRPALTGTAWGAAATAALLVVVGERPVFYAAALPPVMLVAFTVGPMLGLAWAQGTFTVVVALVFTQLAPVGWQLAEARLVNVATGAAIGILAGLCAWPRGGGQDLRRRTAELLTDSALALRETVGVVTGTGPAHGALRRARLTALLTEASYAQYRSERHDAAEGSPNWQAALLAGMHTVRGAEPLLARIPAGTAAVGPAAAASLVRDADRVAAAFRQRASDLLARAPLDGAGRDRPPGAAAGPGVAPTAPAEGTGATGPDGSAERRLAEARDSLLDEHTGAARMPAELASLHTVDVVVWLGGLLDDLARVTAPAPRTVEAGSG